MVHDTEEQGGNRDVLDKNRKILLRGRTCFISIRKQDCRKISQIILTMTREHNKGNSLITNIRVKNC